jgi:anti-anti-sigma factor
MMALSLQRNADTLHLQGDIVFANANECCERGLVLLAEIPGDAVIDLAGLHSASSLSVAVLLRWARNVAAKGQALRLANVSEKCRAIVQVSGLTEVLPEIN